MIGIIPFLVQWLALSHLGRQLSNLEYPPKSHWTLLSEFQRLSEDEIEEFLPQVCNILIDRDTLADSDAFSYLERSLFDKCAGCLTFGMRVCNLLKAASQIRSENIFAQVLSNNAAAQAKEERLRYLQDNAETATAFGANLPDSIRFYRSSYYRDVVHLLGSLARLGIELKAYPKPERTYHLRIGISQLNAVLYNRMLSGVHADIAGGFEGQGHHHQQQQQYLDHPHHPSYRSPSQAFAYNHGSAIAMNSGITSSNTASGSPSAIDMLHAQVARECPTAAGYSIHLPLQHCRENVMRILRFVEAECEVLPSKERCPFLIVAEVLEQPFTCNSNLLFAQGQLVREAQRRRDALIVSAEQGQGRGRGQGDTIIRATPVGQRNINNRPGHAATEYGVNGYEFNSNYGLSSGDDHLQHSPSRYYDRDSTDDIRDEGTGVRNENADLFSRPAFSQQQGEEARVATDSFDEESSDTAGFVCDISGSSISSSRVTSGTSQSDYDDEISNKPSDATAPADISNNSNDSNDSNDYSHSRLPSSSSSRPRRLRRNVALEMRAGGDNSIAQQYSDAYAHGPPSHHTSTAYTNYPAGPGHTGYNYPSHHHQLQTPQPKKLFKLRKTWLERKEMVRATSMFGNLPGWTLRSFIVKSGDDLRKEILAMQLVEFFQRVFKAEGIDVILKPYQIVCTGFQSGIVEFLEGTRSIDNIKKSCTYSEEEARVGAGIGDLSGGMYDPASSFSSRGFGTPLGSASGSFTEASGGKMDPPTIREYFEFLYGPSYSYAHGEAVMNFARSLAGYSLVTYLLQVKDRHNANILLDGDGSLIHIDFGFILGESPGFNINFENAPFKLTKEYVEVMGGVDSEAFKTFEDLFVRGFFALQKHVDALYSMVQLFMGDKRRAVADALKTRLMFPSSQADVLELVRESFDSWRTKQYDWFQQKTNNIQM